MIVAKKSSNYDYYSYHDNYAYDYEKYDKQIKEKKDTDKRYIENHQKRVKGQLKMIFLVLLMFGVGILIIGRYALIVNMNNQCGAIKNKISVNQKENDYLKLELLKFYDIKQIEKEATSKFSMVRPAKINIVYLNVKTENKNENTSEDDKNKIIADIMGKIMKFVN